jgi:hypothetical protein
LGDRMEVGGFVVAGKGAGLRVAHLVSDISAIMRFERFGGSSIEHE